MKPVNIKSILVFFLSAFSFSAAGKQHIVEIGQFEKLKVNSNISVVYRNLPDSTGFATYTAPENEEDLFIFTTKGNGTLRVQAGRTQWGNNSLPVVYVYSDFLNSVESSSDLTITVENPAPSANFNVNQIGNGTIIVDNVKCSNLSAAITTGNGTIILSGSCTTASLRMVGAGLISADLLKADDVKCSILGTGTIGCWPIDNLSVKGLGTTKIYYKGSPNVKKSGGGKLFELPDASVFDKTGTPVSSFAEPSESAEKTATIENEEEEDEEDLDDESEEEEEEEEDSDPEDENYQTVVTQDE